MSSKIRTIFRRWVDVLRPINAEEKAFWWGLILPLGVLVVVLKIWRVIERAEFPTWWATPDLLRSDLLAISAAAALGWAVLRAFRARGRIRRAGLAIIQIPIVVWAALEMIANHFYTVTGSTFDLHLLFFSLGRINETFSIVASEVSMASWALLVAVTAAFVLLPWGLFVRAKRSGKSAETMGADGANSTPPTIAIAVGVVCAALAAIPAFGEDYAAFGRANIVNMALSLNDVGILGSVEITQVREPLYGLELSPTDAVDEGPRNVAIIILESTRASSMTVYNPELETTPFLAGLAEESTVADRAYAVVPHTSKSLVSILCGLEPQLRMPITEGLPDGLPVRCLPNLLGDEGYSSVFLQSATEAFEDRPGLVENMGFEDFIPLEKMNTRGFEKANYFGREDMVMLAESRKWLASRDADEPFVATYLTLTPHHHYLAPRRFGRHDFAEDDELNRYKNAVHYVDQFTGELMAQYEELGLRDDTLFIIVGDHGEGFEEHGRSQHDNVVWEEGLRVPFMVFDPSRPEGERLDHPVSLLDVTPTVLDWLGYEVDGGEFPGMPIYDSDEHRRVYANCWYERRCMASIGQRWKYIDHFGRRSVEVYDLLEDPSEQNNLAGEKKDEIRQWRAELYGWRESVNALYRAELADQVAKYIHDDLPDSAIERNFQIGDFVRYRGYEIDVDELRRGKRARVTHYFEALQPIPPDWKLFVHGVGESMLNLDHVPIGGLHPLEDWEPGTIIADEHTFRIPRDWSPGTFTLYLGIYHSEEGRAPVSGDAETDDDRPAIFEMEFR